MLRCSVTAAANSASSPKGGDGRSRIGRFAVHTSCSHVRSRCSKRSTRSRQEREPNPALYRMLTGALRTLARRARNPLVTPAFFWRYRRRVPPLLDECARCTEEYEALVAFDVNEGGMLCAPCARGGGRPVSPAALDVMRQQDARRDQQLMRPRRRGRRGRTPRRDGPRTPHRAPPPLRHAVVKACPIALSLMANANSLDKIVNLAKRRGFVFRPARSTRLFVHLRLRPPRRTAEAQRQEPNGGARWCRCATTWSASTPRSHEPEVLGGVRSRRRLHRPARGLQDCKRFRADHCGGKCNVPGFVVKAFNEARQFNLLFKTFVGPVEEDASVAYLRPETAQGIFVNFFNV